MTQATPTRGGETRGTVYFERGEIDRLLSLYSRRVAEGDWRDYAIDLGRDVAMFSIYSHSRTVPLYRIVKGAAANGRAAIFWLDSRGRRLRTAESIADVLAPIDGRLRVVT
jgi:hypothetical protein